MEIQIEMMKSYCRWVLSRRTMFWNGFRHRPTAEGREKGLHWSDLTSSCCKIEME